MLLQDDLEKVLDFIQQHLKYHDRELLKEYVLEHEKYSTIDYAIDNHGHIVAVCRWNMSSDGEIALILDFAIRDDFRSVGVGKDFVLRALKKFPSIKKLQFQRGVRGDIRPRILPIAAILKRNIF